jgi:predicted Rossmann fold flavoprotein
MKTDVSIIGAGPAGLCAAIFAAQAGAKTIVLERNTTACRKLLRTGGGRCNLTHTGSVEDFVRAYGPFGRFLKHSLYEFSADDLRRYFAQRGLPTKAEKEGCIFPDTDRASDVARVLLDHAQMLSVRFLYGKTARSIEKKQDGFVALADTEKVFAKAVIIATGGVTWPATGSTGDGYQFAGSFGHTIVDPRASLAPLVTAQTWLARNRKASHRKVSLTGLTGLAGVAVPHVVIKAKVANRRLSASGPLMFTDSGIGGPAALDFSRLITDFLPDYANPIKATIDMMPQYQIDRLDKEIVSLCSQHPKKTAAAVLAKLLPRSLASSLLSQIDTSETILAGQFPKSRRMQVVKMLKELPLSIVATCPIAQATVTRGGVCTDEIDPKTMESRLCPGLFFAGEIINADGPCGGYNLQIAFSTGHLAGKTAARKSLSTVT